ESGLRDAHRASRGIRQARLGARGRQRSDVELGLILVGGTARPQVDLARRAEAAGFASVWSAEFWNQHPYAVLGATAEATERLGTGTAIANAFPRWPVVHATAVLNLDELSRGRMTLGLGRARR